MVTRSELLDKARAQIDENIRSLKEKRNELAFISLLPPETLCRIFLLISTSPPPEHKGPQTRAAKVKAGFPGLLWYSLLTHVCCRWRAVAVGYPQLWLDIFALPNGFMDEMLRRSSGAAITLKISHSQTRSAGIPREVLDVLATHVARTRTLELRLSDMHMKTITTTMATIAAPELVTLRVEISTTNGLPAPPFNIPSSFFAGGTPRLRHVNLISCHVESQSISLLNNLTHLTLHKTYPPFHFSISDLLSALERSKGLEYLNLHNCITQPGGSTNVIVRLPRLLRLKVGNLAPVCVDILSHIHFPDHTKVSLDFSFEEEDDVDPLLQLVADQVHRAHAYWPITGIHLSGPALFSLQLFNDNGQPNSPSSDASGPIFDCTCEIYEYRTDGAIFAMLASVYSQALPLAQVKEVIIQQVKFAPFQWADVLLQLPQVEKLVLRELWGFGLFEALSRVQSEPKSAAESDGEGKLLPKLRILEMDEVTMDVTVTHPQNLDSVSAFLQWSQQWGVVGETGDVAGVHLRKEMRFNRCVGVNEALVGFLTRSGIHVMIDDGEPGSGHADEDDEDDEDEDYVESGGDSDSSSEPDTDADVDETDTDTDFYD
ncbi:hypothetical protein JAAARDRAFT_300893 [Jaapia argillacea MUCL 33604]|uniref:Uncharacterized protein n=1 Tax=Jaapia argillacea MUCL 33604 TaxID=933084 RepID=A0A067Q2E3_9AGAM|nr:hypothetical protein JAAARDRAFT_300893 [Jaapia argillacea MUCL 33604]